MQSYDVLWVTCMPYPFAVFPHQASCRVKRLLRSNAVSYQYVSVLSQRDKAEGILHLVSDDNDRQLQYA